MSQNKKTSTCPHVTSLGAVSWSIIRKAQKHEVCDTCEMRATNLWLCLVGRCTYVGCGESLKDHSSHHAQLDFHCLAINLATLRIWCYRCQSEVFHDRNNPPVLIPDKLSKEMEEDDQHSEFTPDNSPQHSAFGGDDTESDGDDEVHHGKPKGLTGLQNLGNTCYLNAALQALSNCPPLTRFFLDCGGYVHADRSMSLSKNYMKLMHEIWHRKRPSYLVPSGIVSGIKLVHPMFRGYSQQDTQEFLRCFMDQLHEECKQPIIEELDDREAETEIHEEHQTSCDWSTSCQWKPAAAVANQMVTMKLVILHQEVNSEDASDAINRPGYLKVKKDSINMSMRAGDNTSTCSDDQRSDSGDFVDAENEPLRSRRRGGKRTVSDSSDREQANLYSRRQPVQYKQSVSTVTVSTTKETFQDLSLPIPSKDHLHMLHSTSHNSGQKGGACSEVHQGWLQWMVEWMRSWFLGPVITLQDCLAAFFSADELKGDNMYSCEKCKKLRNGLKYSKVLQLPEILSIHLKRFRHEFYSSKIGTYVSFPLTNLDMKPYLHKDHVSNVTVYDLVAVICHHGTAGGGHYTAYCQNVLTEHWYEFDDQYVTEVDVNQVINCEAYVLFYRKQNDHMNSVRQEAMELMNKREPSLMHFFVSKQWINRFNTFAEPGPITNQDFLCPHGGVPPSKTEYIGDLVEPLTQAMWEFLHQRFGGGPSCNHLFPCTTCHKELETLRNRQKTELEEFIKLNERFKEEDNPSVIYAISMSWFKEWENFVREKEDNPPGPVDNKRIAVMKNGQLIVRPNSDHGQLSKDMWQYLYQIYGGGPELVIKQINTQPERSRTLAEQASMASGTKGHERVNSESSSAATSRGNPDSVGKGNPDSMGKGNPDSLENSTECQDSTGNVRGKRDSTGSSGTSRGNLDTTETGSGQGCSDNVSARSGSGAREDETKGSESDMPENLEE
ncbi:ubiquitin carboxyl-terminal hydrolase 20-like [Ruditapes philippinarum]|uniref:ubiquitin carboxyl-terminal hydrolase 20-like n=1 Tax=Ruditapes philippinarum TaxID=129788 RepID=UPI00295A7488|nr:ubiquitin carboxyl-terminal hydrolase 20-like [Ruditapes philippinarum]